MTNCTHTFNATADYFDHPALSFWGRFGSQTIEQAGLFSGASVLDVCCGTGASALPAAKKVGPTGSVLAIDVADKLLELGKQKAARNHLTQLRFQQGNIENLDFESGRFDTIVCVFGIFFLADPISALSRFWKWLKPSGTLAITTWGKRAWEPAESIFLCEMEREKPGLATVAGDEIGELDVFRSLFLQAGIGPINITEHKEHHHLKSPEDWWTIVLGSNYRGAIEQLDEAAKIRVKQKTSEEIESREINSIEMNVLYGLAKKP